MTTRTESKKCGACGKPSGRYDACFSCAEEAKREAGIRDAVAVRVAATMAADVSLPSEDLAARAWSVADAVVAARRRRRSGP